MDIWIYALKQDILIFKYNYDIAYSYILITRSNLLIIDVSINLEVINYFMEYIS